MSWAALTAARTRVLATSTLTAFALSASLAGCSGGPDGAEAGDSPSAPASPKPSSTAAPTSASPTRTPTTASASPTQPTTTVATTEDVPSAAPVEPPPPGAGPREMLLGAAQIAGLNDQHGWKPIGTENAERPNPVWACEVADLTAIGATGVWTRRFVGQPGGGESAKARSVVVTFPDSKTAQRAYAVLRSWHDRCEDQLSEDYQRVRVDAAPTAVAVDQGGAEWRLAIYGPVRGDADASYFDATGYVRNGRRISLTTIVSVGQDYDYPPGEEPIVGAVRNAAVKLRG